MKTKKLGKNHPGIANQLSNLGNIYVEQGKLKLAEQHYF